MIDAAAVAAALAAHAVAHRANPRSLAAILATLFLAPAALAARDAHQPLRAFFRALATYLPALGLSVAAYRLSPLHPLARLPGPPLARVSGWWMFVGALSGKQHLLFRRLHARYGDIVRTGPDHVHVFDAAAVPTVLGPHAQFHRPDGYEVALPPGAVGSLLTLCDPATHRARRRAWDRAFSGPALKHYEPMLARRLAELRAALDARCGRPDAPPTDLSEWIGFFTLDFMGDFALGGALDFMRQGCDPTGFHRTIVDSMGLVDLLSKVSWVRAFVHLLPSPLEAMLRKAQELAERRKAAPSGEKDLFHYLIDDSDPDALAPATLAQEALVAIIAGSDTSGSVLANAMFHLLTNPPALARLRAELDAAFPDDADADPDWERLKACEYLQAVIKETMRLAPALPNGPPRRPPPGGGPVEVAGHILPEDAVVYLPFYTLFREKRYFSPDPDSFRPERWLGELDHLPDFALNEQAFIPFNYGPTACVGRQLAQNEVRSTLALLVHRYDIRLSPDWDPAEWERNLRDRFILARGAMPVLLSRRSVESQRQIHPQELPSQPL